MDISAGLNSLHHISPPPAPLSPNGAFKKCRKQSKIQKINNQSIIHTNISKPNHLQTKINTHMPSAKLMLVFLFHELVFLILQQSAFVGFLIPRLVRLSYSPASSSFRHNRSYLSSQICVISKCINVR